VVICKPNVNSQTICKFISQFLLKTAVYRRRDLKMPLFSNVTNLLYMLFKALLIFKRQLSDSDMANANMVW